MVQEYAQETWSWLAQATKYLRPPWYSELYAQARLCREQTRPSLTKVSVSWILDHGIELKPVVRGIISIKWLWCKDRFRCGRYVGQSSRMLSPSADTRVKGVPFVFREVSWERCQDTRRSPGIWRDGLGEDQWQKRVTEEVINRFVKLHVPLRCSFFA